MSLRAVEDDVEKRQKERDAALHDRGIALERLIQEKEAALKSVLELGETQVGKISALIARSGKFESLIAVAEQTPYVFLSEARQSSDPTMVAVRLQQILEHNSAGSAILEIAGDEARSKLGDGEHSLAAKLYARAIKDDPSRVSARAEYLYTCFTSGGSAAQTISTLKELVAANPSVSTVLECLINCYIKAGDFRGLLEYCAQSMDVAANTPLLLRNIAVAKQNLRHPANEVRSAYETALAQSPSGGAYVNVARVYANYLIECSEPQAAIVIVDKALLSAPREGSLHHLRSQALRALGRSVDEVRGLMLGLQFADPAARLIMSERLLDIVAIYEMGLVPQTPELGEALASAINLMRIRAEPATVDAVGGEVRA